MTITPALTYEERRKCETKTRVQLAISTVYYLEAKDLTTGERRQLTKLAKDCDDTSNQRAIRLLAKPFYLGDCRQIAAKLEAKRSAMEPKHQRAFDRATSKAESALFDPAECFADLKGLAALYKVRLPKLETVRAAPTTDLDPPDRISLARFLPMPA